MPNPFEDYVESKTAASEARRDEELKMWRHWDDNGRKPEHLEPLLKKYNPTINQMVQRWKAPAVPESAFRAELQTQIIKAVQTFDPARGVALGTHVIGRLPKAMRYNNRHQNVAYIPEGKSRFIGPINKAENILREELGRDPTHIEVSQHLQGSSDGDYRKLTPSKVEEIQKARIRDIPESHPGFEEYDPIRRSSSFEQQQISVAQSILPQIFPNKPDLHTVFNHVFGTNDHQQISSTGALAKKMGKTDQQISRMKTEVGNTLRKYMGIDKE